MNLSLAIPPVPDAAVWPLRIVAWAWLAAALVALVSWGMSRGMTRKKASRPTVGPRPTVEPVRLPLVEVFPLNRTTGAAAYAPHEEVLGDGHRGGRPDARRG